MDMFGNIHEAKGVAFKATTLICLLALHACGGGSGASPTTSQASIVPVETPAPSNVVVDSIAQPEAFIPTVAVTPGWSEPTGTSLGDFTSLTRWSFSSQKVTSWTPGNLELLSYSDSSKAIALNFDFGCATSVITTRTADCRNVVAMATTLVAPVVASSNGVIALTVRNVDAAAEFALRIRDASGQTLQYPFQIRTIENQNPSDWVKVRVALKSPSVYWGGDNNGILAASINQISVVAAPRNSDSALTGLNYPKGSFEIKSAKFLPATGVTYRLQTNASVNTDGLLPSLSGRMIVANGSFDPVLLQKAKDAGFSGLRRDLLWDVVERGGSYSFSEFSAGAENLTALGMKVLWILDYGHPDHGGAIPQSADDIAAFGRFAQAAAQFGKTSQNVIGFEVWNEPNLSNWWPNPDPVLYGRVFESALTAVRNVDAGVPVISGGVTIDEPSYLFKLARSGSLRSASGVGVHPYRKDTYVTTSPSYKRTYISPEMYANDSLVTKKYLASQGVTAPPWNTESGYSSAFFLDPVQYPNALSSEAKVRVGNLVLRNVLTQIALNERLITVFRLIDKGVSSTDKEMNFGLLDASGAEKPSYVALKVLNDQIKGKSFNGPHSDVPPGVHALRWSDSGTNTKTICLWIDTPSENASITLPSGVKAVKNWLGVALSAKAGDAVTLTEASGPIYVNF